MAKKDNIIPLALMGLGGVVGIYYLFGRGVGGEDCPEGFHKDINGVCVKDFDDCPFGTHRDPTTGQCVIDDVPCEPGFHKDPLTGLCVENVVPPTPPFGIVETALGYNATISMSSRYNSDLTDRMTVGVYSRSGTIPRTILVILKPDGTVYDVLSGFDVDQGERQDRSFFVNKSIPAELGTWTVYAYGFEDTATTTENFYLGKSGQLLGTADDTVVASS